MSEKTLTGACVIGQSGGPSAVINTSALGVICTALGCDCITAVYGAAHGIKGILNDRLYDMGLEDSAELDLLRHTPSSELGSCRYKMKDADLDDTDYRRILEVFQRHNIRYFFYNGGNDSMDTCNKVSKYLQQTGYDCRVIGIPKTIDNDLNGTDCCPGYGSAAKYIASSMMEIYRDASVYDTGAVTIVEIMGRNAGWLTASAALASEMGAGPDLIYVPEVTFDLEKFLSDIEEVWARRHNVLVAVSEGIRDANGIFLSEYSSDTASSVDAFGHAQMGGCASALAAIVKARTGRKVRGIELSLLQRCATHLASRTDSDIAYMVGEAAVDGAVAGITDKMVSVKRISQDGAIRFVTELVPLEIAANIEKKLPLEWLNDQQNGLLQPFLDYVSPLIQGELEYPTVNGLPRHARLKKILVK